MNWQDVGDWLKKNAAPGAALVGSLLTGNVPGAVAAGVALVSSATGQGDPARVLESLQGDPGTVVRLRELALQSEASIRDHIQAMAEMEAKERQHEHEQTQLTVRSGDNAQDIYVRQTRPRMARQSWYATAGYLIGAEIAKAAGYGGGAVIEIAMVLSTPAWAYIGLRTWDKKWGKSDAAR